ncbi:MAG: hypothetical protein ACWGO1_01485 [Anaerolineales bacterium]
MDDKHQEYQVNYFRQLVDKPVVLKDSLEQVGKLVDILIEPNLLEVGAIQTSHDRWLVRPVESIPAEQVTIQNRDVILVSGFKLIDQRYQPESHWLSVCEVIHGQEVVSTGGAKLGEIHDIQLDERGLVVAYQLDWEPEAGSRKYDRHEDEKLVPVIATHALDAEVMIVNEDVLAEQGIKI